MNRCGFKQQFRFDLGSIPSSAIGVDLIIFFSFASTTFVGSCVFLALDTFHFFLFFYIYIYIYKTNLSSSIVDESGWLYINT